MQRSSVILQGRKLALAICERCLWSDNSARFSIKPGRWASKIATLAAHLEEGIVEGVVVMLEEWILAPVALPHAQICINTGLAALLAHLAVGDELNAEDNHVNRRPPRHRCRRGYRAR